MPETRETVETLDTVNTVNTLTLYRQTLEMLDTKAGSLFTEFKDQLQCRKGCSGCCINGFKIRYIEGLNLLSGFAQAAPETAAAILQNLADPHRPACPVLVDNACSLYAHRPALCRAYGIIVQLEDTLATCPLNFQDAPDDLPLKSLDMKPYYEILDELSRQMWEIQPMSSLSATAEPPVFSIRQLFEAFMAVSRPAAESINSPKEAAQAE